MIIPDSGMGFTLKPVQQQDSGGQKPRQVVNDPEAPPQGGEEVTISAQAREKKPASDTREKRVPHETRGGREHAESGRESAMPTALEDNLTGRKMSLVNSQNGAALAMFTQEPEAPKITAASYGVAKNASVYREYLERLIDQSTWAHLEKGKGIQTADSTIRGLTDAQWDETASRIETLSKDPAKGGKPTPGSVEEAVVGVYAEMAGIAAPPVIRESTGAAEFVDGNHVQWDVKSPKSPPPGARWVFDPDHQVVKIRHDQSNGEKVMLNLSCCNQADTATLLALLNRELSDEECRNIVILVNKEALHQ
jgi:hypothetical protein